MFAGEKVLKIVDCMGNWGFVAAAGCLECVRLGVSLRLCCSGIKTLFLMTKRMRAPSLGLDNRDDFLYFLLFAGLICEQLFEWYQGLEEVENSSILDWSSLACKGRNSD